MFGWWIDEVKRRCLDNVERRCLGDELNWKAKRFLWRKRKFWTCETEVLMTGKTDVLKTRKADVWGTDLRCEKRTFWQRGEKMFGGCFVENGGLDDVKSGCDVQAHWLLSSSSGVGAIHVVRLQSGPAHQEFASLKPAFWKNAGFTGNKDRESADFKIK